MAKTKRKAKKWDNHPRNMKKAERAGDALDAHIVAPANDIETELTDLLTNIMHLCGRDGLDFDGIVVVARNHFLSEGGEGEIDDIEESERLADAES